MSHKVGFNYLNNSVKCLLEYTTEYRSIIIVCSELFNGYYLYTNGLFFDYIPMTNINPSNRKKKKKQH